MNRVGIAAEELHGGNAWIQSQKENGPAGFHLPGRGVRVPRAVRSATQARRPCQAGC
ncbi:hypothetical protein BN2476_230269 [Paraburkholderia piptadeniae]|uniref:Uncharacterized protein n=1 Tax=Paraburkholderia piptadeniae TaxID=1701573 RepID=A0A1N7RXL0_9BURK|nr:hypothetical protein BN2476_230269 [Paraburkholderia piptadeniae]